MADGRCCEPRLVASGRSLEGSYIRIIQVSYAGAVGEQRGTSRWPRVGLCMQVCPGVIQLEIFVLSQTWPCEYQHLQHSASTRKSLLAVSPNRNR
jgi:hypothetical protein